MNKPSDRIWQIFHEKRQWAGGNKNGDMLQAVITYLDEQHEQKVAGETHCPSNWPKIPCKSEPMDLRVTGELGTITNHGKGNC